MWCCERSCCGVAWASPLGLEVRRERDVLGPHAELPSPGCAQGGLAHIFGGGVRVSSQAGD